MTTEATAAATATSLLKQFGPSLWIVAGPTVDFYGFDYTTRMAIVQLENGGTWVWSPVALTEPLLYELKHRKLDNVLHVVAPNKIHNLFLRQWQDAFPDAKFYDPPGLKSRNVVKDITFHCSLANVSMTKNNHNDSNNKNDLFYLSEIDQVIVEGSAFMQEVVFFHKKSQTVLICDLIQRFDEQKGIKGKIMKIDGLCGEMVAHQENGDYHFSWVKIVPERHVMLLFMIGNHKI